VSLKCRDFPITCI